MPLEHFGQAIRGDGLLFNSIVFIYIHEKCRYRWKLSLEASSGGVNIGEQKPRRLSLPFRRIVFQDLSEVNCKTLKLVGARTHLTQ